VNISWVPVILTVSILIQLATAFTAVLLVKSSGFYKPWIFIAAAISLMALRRIISLQNIVTSGVTPAADLGPELIALFISILMLTGILLFRPMFIAIRKNQTLSKEMITQKELLVRESHHHVKNDLQMLSGMIRLQKKYLPEGPVQSFFKDLEIRIQSFSLLHEYVYSPGDEAGSISRYIRQMVKIIREIYSTDYASIPIHLELSDFQVDRKEMLYCGLIVNESLTNAFKYAFPRGEIPSPAITVRTFMEGEKRTLTISDNGVGLPESVKPDQGSYGLTLIRTIGKTSGWSTLVQSPAPNSAGGEDSPGTLVLITF
jgi:two-component sensor histidine kinase